MFQLNSFGLAVMRGSQVKRGEAGATLAGHGPSNGPVSVLPRQETQHAFLYPLPCFFQATFTCSFLLSCNFLLPLHEQNWMQISDQMSRQQITKVN